MEPAEYWNNLQQRERRLVIAGGALLAALLAYLLVWEPLVQRTEQARAAVEELQQQLQWMRQASAEARRLSRGRPVAGSREQSLLAVADSSARRLQLGGAITRIQPDGEQRVRVWLAAASFDALLEWFDDLARRGIQLNSVVVERTAIPGAVDARLVLESQ